MAFLSLEVLSEVLHDALHRVIVLVLAASIALFIYQRLPPPSEEERNDEEEENAVKENSQREQQSEESAVDEVDGFAEDTQEKVEEVLITSEENVCSTAETVIIEDEMQRQLKKCTCAIPLRMHRLGGGKYKISNSNRTCLVRILRSTVMVRVGGGWDPLENFLSKYDPCRIRLTNLGKLPAGSPFSQHMVQFSAKQTVP